MVSVHHSLFPDLLDDAQMTPKELNDNARDIGAVSGILLGIELTPTLLPNQKEAIAAARKAISRIQDRNCSEIKFRAVFHRSFV